MKPRDADQGAPAGAPTETLTTTATADDRHKSTRRLAEDSTAQFVEVDRWLDSLDVVLFNSLADGSYSPVEACEFMLVGHGIIRRHLDAALVAVV